MLSLVLILLTQANENVVKTLYEKSGGKNGKHGAVSQSQIIAGLSRVGLQLFPNRNGAHFSVHGNVKFHTKSFAILPHFHFLATLSSPPNTGIKDMTVVVSKDDMPHFKAFYNYLSQLTAVMKQFRKRQPAADDADEC
jgi:hypothetical protein